QLRSGWADHAIESAHQTARAPSGASAGHPGGSPRSPASASTATTAPPPIQGSEPPPGPPPKNTARAVSATAAPSGERRSRAARNRPTLPLRPDGPGGAAKALQPPFRPPIAVRK